MPGRRCTTISVQRARSGHVIEMPGGRPNVINSDSGKEDTAGCSANVGVSAAQRIARAPVHIFWGKSKSEWFSPFRTARITDT